MRTLAFAFVAFSLLFLATCCVLGAAFASAKMVVPCVVALNLGSGYLALFYVLFLRKKQRP